jgi:hypothetical protein
MRATAGISGWPTSTPAVYSGSFFYWLWGPQNKNPYGKCMGPYVGTESDCGYAEQNELIDMSSGKIAVFQNRYPDTTITFTPGDKVKNWDILLATVKQGSEDGSTGDSISNPMLGAPNEMPLSTWMCIVNIDNANHIFQVAPPSPDRAHPGSTITSFSGTFQSEYRSEPGTYTATMPPGFNASQTWHCQCVLAFRTQSPIYPANRTYVYWAGSGYAALAIAGVANAKASYNLSRAAAEITDLSSTEAAFDWDPDIVVP